MRTKKSLINMFVGFGGQGLSFIISFVNRIVFIHYLSAEYLGVNGLFGNVIGMLSLAERFCDSFQSVQAACRK